MCTCGVVCVCACVRDTVCVWVCVCVHIRSYMRYKTEVKAWRVSGVQARKSQRWSARNLLRHPNLLSQKFAVCFHSLLFSRWKLQNIPQFNIDWIFDRICLHSSVGQSARLVSARSPVRTWVEASPARRKWSFTRKRQERNDPLRDKYSLQTIGFVRS